MLPENIEVVYRNLEGVHVFTSDQSVGLYVAHRNVLEAYDSIPEGLSKLNEAKYGKPAVYAPMTHRIALLTFLGVQKTEGPQRPQVMHAVNLIFRRKSAP
jgi:hypothetical protein